MKTISIEDRVEIQELTASYAFHCDTAQYERLDGLFAEDGVFDESILGMPIARGRSAIRELFLQSGATIGYLIHLNCNHRISEAGASSARGTTHLHAEGMLKQGEGKRFCILGYYDDEYIKVEGRWLLMHRKLVAIAPLVGFA